MISLFRRIYNFIAYWLFRYTVVTELYMVERWEKYTIHILFGVFFLLSWYFNYAVLLTLIGKVSSSLSASHHGDMKTIAISTS